MHHQHHKPTVKQKARIKQEKARRPDMCDFSEAVFKMAEAREAKDITKMPPCFFDHVHDRVYVQILDNNGNPTSNYKAEDAIPDISEREYRTAED